MGPVARAPSRPAATALINDITRYLANQRTAQRPKMVLAVSGADGWSAMVDGVMAVPGASDAEVEVLHIREYDTSRGKRFFAMTMAEVLDLTGGAVARLSAHGIAATRVVRASTRPEVARAIVHEAAAGGATLLVLGARRRTLLDKVLTHDVVRRVLRQSPCAVLVVPPA